MAYITWKTFYSVGDEALDREHQKIIALVNELYVAIAVGAVDVKKNRILDALVQYASDHFQHEEQLLRECNYPNFESHKALHNDMRQRTLEFHKNLNSVEGPELLAFLKQWWINHIQAEDKQYSPYMSVVAR